jgi:hypothetical protein
MSSSSSSAIEIPAAFSVMVIRDQASSRSDDTINVTREGQYYNVRYINKNEGLKQTVSMTGNDLYKYFKNLLSMLASDDEPFSHVQFNFPATPTVMYKTQNLYHMYDVIMDQFDHLLANWPINVSSS